MFTSWRVKGTVRYIPTGMTGNLCQRVRAHKKKTASELTKKYGAKKLVYYERHDNEQKAKTRERQIKKVEKGVETAID